MTVGALGVHEGLLWGWWNTVCILPVEVEFKPETKWCGYPDFYFVLRMLVLYYATGPETRKSLSGKCTFLCGVPVVHRSTMQKIVQFQRQKLN